MHMCLATYFYNVSWSELSTYKVLTIVLFNDNMHDTLYYEYKLCMSMDIAAKSAWWRANLQQEPFVRLQRIAFVA